MIDEQIKQKFAEAYPDFMRGDEPLSPYIDIWEYAIETMEENKLLKTQLDALSDGVDWKSILEKNEQIKKLQEQIENMKCCQNCKHHQRLFGSKPVVMQELNTTYKDGFKDGYDKANEWHYTKDGDFPKQGQLVTVYRENPLGSNIAITHWYDSYKDTKVQR